MYDQEPVLVLGSRYDAVSDLITVKVYLICNVFSQLRLPDPSLLLLARALCWGCQRPMLKLIWASTTSGEPTTFSSPRRNWVWRPQEGERRSHPMPLPLRGCAVRSRVLYMRQSRARMRPFRWGVGVVAVLMITSGPRHFQLKMLCVWPLA